jgi:pyridoxine 4-dehydrogenase
MRLGDYTVNRMGFGAMRITGAGAWGAPPSWDDAVSVVRQAVDWGVNFIDTADSYGPAVSEEIIAEALYPYPSELVISSKAGMLRPGPGQWAKDGRPEHIRQACEGSLQRLRLEQIHVFHFHRPDEKVPFEDSVGAFAELQQQGKIHHVALSNVSEEQLAQAQALVDVVCVQNRYNVGDRVQEGMVDTCAAQGLAFLPWAPIKDPDSVSAVVTAAERLGASPHQVVLAWLLARSPAMLPIPGTGSTAHLASNIEAAALTLEPGEVEAITAAA